MGPGIGRTLLAAAARRRGLARASSAAFSRLACGGAVGGGQERRQVLLYNAAVPAQPLIGQCKTLIPLGARGFASDGFPDHEVFTMPLLSPTMTHGNLVEWKKNEGDKVAAGDVVCIVETDKATLENVSQEEGFLAKILLQAGPDARDIPVGTPIAILAESADDVPKFASYTSQGGAPASSSKPDQEASPSPTPSPAPSPSPPPLSGPPPTHLGPSVKRLLQESGIDPRSLTGSGPHGYILKGDVLAAMEAGATAAPPTPSPPPPPPPPPPTPAAPKPPKKAASSTPVAPPSQGMYEDVPNSQIRKIIAKRLLESKTGTPHSYASAEAVIDATLALRKNLKEQHGTALSVNDFVVKAVAMALKEVAQANAFFDENTGEVKLNSSVDVAVAVATDRGLMTPIVKNADSKSLAAISAEVKSLAERARAGKLKPDEFQGGTFSISNLGMYPVDRFNAIINPPQAGILAIGRGNKVVVWQEDADGTGKPVTVTKMEVTLSADQRVLDGDVAGAFLEAVTSKLADPRSLLL